MAVATAFPQNRDADAPIIREKSVLNPDGSYAYLFETGNGIFQEQQGTQEYPGTEQQGTSVIGQSAYTSPEGQQIVIQYKADRNGYVAQGDAIPTPPPIPEEILKSLAFIESVPYNQREGQYVPQPDPENPQNYIKKKRQA